jgi:hypothetical protein
MRFLVVGAGATGGYFGGRLLEAGRDGTFLVRPGRAARLAATGLVITSAAGDASIQSPPTVLAADPQGAFDVVVLTCKAYNPRQGDRVRGPGGGAEHGRRAAAQRHAAPRRARRPVRPRPRAGGEGSVTQVGIPHAGDGPAGCIPCKSGTRLAAATSSNREPRARRPVGGSGIRLVGETSVEK